MVEMTIPYEQLERLYEKILRENKLMTEALLAIDVAFESKSLCSREHQASAINQCKQALMFIREQVWGE